MTLSSTGSSRGGCLSLTRATGGLARFNRGAPGGASENGAVNGQGPMIIGSVNWRYPSKPN